MFKTLNTNPDPVYKFSNVQNKIREYDSFSIQILICNINIIVDVLFTKMEVILVCL